MAELIYKDEVYNIVGAAMEVYNHLDPGFLEAVYQEALEIELDSRAIPYQAQQEISVSYKEHRLKKFYIADLLVDNKVMIELKALAHLNTDHEAQLLNQLKATGVPVGVLLSFGSADKLEWKRMVFTKKPSGIQT